MYVRHLAWLNATPDGLKESRIAFFRKQLDRDPDLPPTAGCEYLLEYLFRIGTGKQTGMGLVNLDWTDIDAWCRRSKINLTGWESETIFQMSGSYVSSFLSGKEKSAQPPYGAPSKREEKTKEDISSGILKAFEAAAANGKQKRKSTRRPPDGKPVPPRRGKIKEE